MADDVTVINAPIELWRWEEADGQVAHYWVQVEHICDNPPGNLCEFFIATPDATPEVMLPWYRTKGEMHTVAAQAYEKDWATAGPWSPASDVYMNTYVQPVPEPGGALLVAGALLLAILGRGRRIWSAGDTETR